MGLTDGLMCRRCHVVLTALRLDHGLVLLEEVLRHPIDLDLIVHIYRLFILTSMLLISRVAIVQALLRGCCGRHEFMLRGRYLLGACLGREFIQLIIRIEAVLLLLILLSSQINQDRLIGCCFRLECFELGGGPFWAWN